MTLNKRKYAFNLIARALSPFSFKLLLACVFYQCLPCSLASALPLKMRARENYLVIDVSKAGQSTSYAGFSPTINLWYEEPFSWAFGLGVGPFVTLFQRQGDHQYFADKIRLGNYGFEFKKWHKTQAFLRTGLSYNYFNSNIPSSGIHHGSSIHLGLGYEWSIDKIGLALELGYRHHFLPDGWKITSRSIALGVHFYPLI